MSSNLLILLWSPLFNFPFPYIFMLLLSVSISFTTFLMNCLHMSPYPRFGPVACVWLLFPTTFAWRPATQGLAVMIPPSLVYHLPCYTGNGEPMVSLFKRRNEVRNQVRIIPLRSIHSFLMPPHWCGKQGASIKKKDMYFVQCSLGQFGMYLYCHCVSWKIEKSLSVGCWSVKERVCYFYLLVGG